MQKFEILWELAKWGTGTWSEQMLLEKNGMEGWLTQGCFKPSICKKHNIHEMQQSEVQWNKTSLYS